MSAHDVPLIDLTSSTQDKQNTKDQSFKTDLDLFDSLCCATNDSCYLNVHLPPPLLSNTEPDPFDVNTCLQVFNKVSWDKTENSISGCKSASVVHGSLDSSGGIPVSPAFTSTTSFLQHPQPQLQVNPLISLPGPVFKNGADSSQRINIVDNSPSVNLYDPCQDANNVNCQQLFEGTNNTHINSGTLLYCEPPYEGKQYSSIQSSIRLPGQRLTSISTDRIQNVTSLPADRSQIVPIQQQSGLDLSFKAHLANIIQHGPMSSRSSSVNLPLKLSPPPKFSNKTRNPFYTTQSLPHSVLKPTAKPGHVEPSSQCDIDRAKTEKAFDWLNDALITDMITQQKSPIKETPHAVDMNKKRLFQAPLLNPDSSPLYGSGPGDKNDQLYASNPRDDGLTDQQISLTNDELLNQCSNQYSNTIQPLYANNSSLLTSAIIANKCTDMFPTTTENYAYSSTFSDCTWEDDDDEFDDDFDEISVKDLNLQDSGTMSCKPPPLPPRTYQYNTGSNQTNTAQNKPYILPLKQDGQQLSDTHYFLIPSIRQQDYRREKSSPKKTTAAVKPFMVNSAFDIRDEESDKLEYENVASLLCRDVTQSLSNNSTTSKSSVGSGGSECSSPHHKSLHRSAASSPSKPRPIQPSRKSAVDEEDNTFISCSPRDRIAMVQNQVIGVTDDECYAALSTTHWDVASAVKYLKVEQLFRLGVASRTSCLRLLETLDWNLELASSVIIDEVCSNSAQFEGNA